ncbi:MAG: transposase [Nitrospinae bacterium]|nr:transposase [Nitrospinota bacterium]
MEFKSKVFRLRGYFKQFNTDVSEICQWLMGLRPGGKRGNSGTDAFWKFFLEPDTFLAGQEKEEGDLHRRLVFDFVAGIIKSPLLSEILLSDELSGAIQALYLLVPTPTATKLFERLKTLDAGHRQVLLKAAAEWVVSRYQRGYENRERQKAEWGKEKVDWENKHLELGAEIRTAFTDIFKKLGIREKRARVCSWERLKANKDNCEYAGVRISKKNHNGFCQRYRDFINTADRSKKKFFPKNAADYLKLRVQYPKDSKKAWEKFLGNNPNGRWFPDAWETYLKVMNIKEATIIKKNSGLPHCTQFGDDDECSHNKHTEKCKLYQAELDQRPDLQPLEGLYREWRREFLAAPAKPTFQYPSQNVLPIPKIFGKGYFRTDFASSSLELRLDEMKEGEFIHIGIVPWPKGYQPQPEKMEVTSVHISFSGTRGRAGFHFNVAHEKSRFGVSQDAIDELRSRAYPRKAQDRQFLENARKLLIESFDGELEKNLRMFVVDLGTNSAAAASFAGKEFKKSFPLKVVKIEKLYDATPEPTKSEKKGETDKNTAQKGTGLRLPHVAKHLEVWFKKAAEIGEKKRELGVHDLRRLALHLRWMIRDWVRLNASQIIMKAEEEKSDLIVFESLRGFRAPGYDKLEDEKKRRLAFFSYGAIRRKVVEKAVERGMRVVTVPYFKSSQFCSKCGKEHPDLKELKKDKRARKFKCPFCKTEVNCDENAARVLGKVFWGEIQLPDEVGEKH